MFPAVEPLRLRCDNFTPASRTPWGGRRIVEVIKAGLSLSDDKAAYPVVGESWEFSVDPAFPSELADGRALSDALPEAAGTPMLLKLLDAADRLSVQVHPADDYAGLEAGESGKPECWHVLHRELGAGVYLGLAEGATRAGLEAALAAGDDLTPMLNFVPVSPGDCFVIGPGTVHAVGAGVTLVEPQLVHPGRTGRTYRLWDWNRRYDATGRRDPGGRPRALHVAGSLAATRFDGLRGAAFVESCRCRREPLGATPGVAHERLTWLEEMSVERLAGTGLLHMGALGTLGALVVTSGVIVVGSAGTGATRLELRSGESAALPAGLGDLAFELEGAEAVLTWCRP